MFKKGHTFIPPSTTSVEPQEKPIVRLNNREHSSIVEYTIGGEILTRDSLGQPVPCMLLRPKGDSETYFQTYDQKTSIPEGEDNTYMVLHRSKVIKLFNSAFKNHKILYPNCEGDLEWDEHSTQQWGLCWSAALRCSCCGFVSQTSKLYDEIDRDGVGRKTAAPNLGLQLGMARQGIGNEGVIDILQATNIAAPSSRGMQKTANRVSTIIEKVNREDMTERTHQLKELNVKRGLSMQAGIAVEADGMYNNRLCSGAGKTPAQPATRAVYHISENMTNDKQVISLNIYSKLCSCRGRGHKEDCTATLPPDAVISNEGGYWRIGENEVYSIGGLRIDLVTMDGDSNANAVARERGVVVSTCTTHLTRRSSAKIKQSAFSNTMFPGRLKADQEKFQSRFATDLSKRCQAELQEAAKTCPGNLEAISSLLEYTPDAIIACYEGKHSLCHQYSLVCKKKAPWTRPFLTFCGSYQNSETTFITPTHDDVKILKECLSMRFSVQALRKTYLNRTQNKSEATNRALTKSLPKHMEFPRNASGRAHAAVHSQNNSPGQSLLILREAAGAPIPRRSRVVKQLEKRDKVVKSHKLRQATQKFKSNRAQRRNERYARYDHSHHVACYKKGGFLTDSRRKAYNTREARRQQSTFTSSVEHAYARDKTVESIKRKKAVRAEHSY